MSLWYITDSQYHIWFLDRIASIDHSIVRASLNNVCAFIAAWACISVILPSGYVGVLCLARFLCLMSHGYIAYNVIKDWLSVKIYLLWHKWTDLARRPHEQIWQAKTHAQICWAGPMNWTDKQDPWANLVSNTIEQIWYTKLLSRTGEQYWAILVSIIRHHQCIPQLQVLINVNNTILESNNYNNT